METAFTNVNPFYFDLVLLQEQASQTKAPALTARIVQKVFFPHLEEKGTKTFSEGFLLFLLKDKHSVCVCVVCVWGGGGRRLRGSGT